MDLMELSAKLSLDSSAYESGLKQSESSFKSFGDKISSWTVAKGQMIANFAKQAASNVKTIVSDVLGEGQSFDVAISQVAATMGKSMKEMESMVGSVDTKFGNFTGNLREYARFMGANTEYSATQAAEALNYMALAGYDADTAMGMLPNVLNLASAGAMELASASDMITDASSALGLDIAQTETMVDQMAKTASKANTSVSQLGDAILSVGANARGLKGGTVELNAVLGKMADVGIKGSYAGTKLSSILTRLKAPSKQAKEALGDLGVNIWDTDGQMRGLDEIFTDMSSKLSEMDGPVQEEILKKIFGQDNTTAVKSLLGVTAEEWEALMKEIADSEGAAADMAETQLDNLAGDVTKFNSALSEAKLIISDKLTPTLRKFVQYGTSGLSRLTTAFTAGGFEAVGKELKAIFDETIDKLKGSDDERLQKFGESLEKVRKAASWLKLALTDLPAALDKLKIKAKDLYSKIEWPTWQDIKGSLKKTWNDIKTRVKNIGKTFGGLVFGTKEDGSVDWPTWEAVKAKAKRVWGTIKAEATKIGGAVFGTKEDGSVDWPTWDSVKAEAEKVWNNIKTEAKNIATTLGGLVFGKKEDGSVDWPSWEDIKAGAEKLWKDIQTNLLTLGTTAGKLVFGKKEDGTVDWPTWDDVKTAAETAWNTIKTEAAKLKGLVFGDAADAGDIFDTIQEKWTNMKTTIEGGAIQIATYFFGSSDPGTIKSSIEGVSSALEAIGVAVATYFTVEKVKGIIDMFKNLKTTLMAGVGSNKVGLILSAIAAAITLIVENWDKIEPVLQQFSGWITENVIQPMNDFIDTIKTVIKKIGDFFGIDTSGWFKKDSGLPEPGDSTGPQTYQNAHLDDEQIQSLIAARQLAMQNPNALFMGTDGVTRNAMDGFVKTFEDTLRAGGFDDKQIEKFSSGLGALSDSEFADLMTVLRNAEGYYDESGKKVGQLGDTSSSSADSVSSLGSAANSAASALNSVQAPSGSGFPDSWANWSAGMGKNAHHNAKGNWDVPYDDYLTRLHRGEMVLTASQARKYRENSRGSDLSGLGEIVREAIAQGMSGATVQSFLSGKDITDDTNRRTARQLKARRFAT